MTPLLSGNLALESGIQVRDAFPWPEALPQALQTAWADADLGEADFDLHCT